MTTKKKTTTKKAGRPKGSYGGGGKLARTETVTIRLDQKLRFAADLGAKKHRRTLSSFIEWSIEQVIKNVELLNIQEDMDSSLGGQPSYRTALDAMNNVWDVEEADRFAKMAMIYPNLLTHEEEMIWKLAIEDKTLWKKRNDQSGNYKEELKFTNFNFKEFRKHWRRYNNIAKNRLSLEHSLD